jgi:DNA-binding MurR/RpiR family transcriptional regulator
MKYSKKNLAITTELVDPKKIKKTVELIRKNADILIFDKNVSSNIVLTG